MNLEARAHFVAWAALQIGDDVLWGAKGDDLFDCSGLVTWCLWKCGGADLRNQFNSQRLYRTCVEYKKGDEPQPGDLAFYGHSDKQIIHVAILVSRGRVISASGASGKVLTIDEARQRGACVELKQKVKYRKDTSLIEVRRNVLIDGVHKTVMPTEAEVAKYAQQFVR